MEISKRLKAIADMVTSESVCDIGTDHGYIPIYLVNNVVVKYAIASDINKGPLNKAKVNINNEKLNSVISCRLGSGLETIEENEVNSAIIAGMGGNLIRDIIEKSIDVVKTMEYLVLQPVQNPEVLRKYIYEKGFHILEEKVVKDEGKFYQIIKVKFDVKPKKMDEIYYEIGEEELFVNKTDREDFLESKLIEYKKILEKINDDNQSASAILRKADVENKIKKLEKLVNL